VSRLRWWLGDSATMEPIRQIRTAKGKTINEDLNAPGSAQLTIPIEDEVAALFEVIRTCVMVTRSQDIVWSGPVWSIKDDATQQGGITQIGAKGWLARLDKRLVHPDQRKTLTAEAYEHIHTLLQFANDRGVVLSNSPSSTMIVPGLRGSNGVQLTKTYEQFASIGGSILEMTKIENGVDIAVDPGTRELDVYKLRGKHQENLVWRLRGSRPNLQSASRTIDADSFGNRQWVLGANGVVGHADDDASQGTYGLFEQQTSLTNVPNPEILGAFANAEILIKGRPVVIHEVSPAASVVGEAPVAYDDFNVGDFGRISVSSGRYQLVEQDVRVFGFVLKDDDDGVERITSLKLEAQ
jgi:hypothetical protein